MYKKLVEDLDAVKRLAVRFVIHSRYLFIHNAVAPLSIR